MKSLRLTRFARAVLAGAVAVALAGTAPAAFVPLTLGPTDSGWTWDNSSMPAGNITVTDINTGASTLTITVSKDFTDIKTPVLLTFQQDLPDAQTMARIIIHSESIKNDTGVNWTAFRWSIFETGTALFDPSASGGWTVTPFSPSPGAWQSNNGSPNGALLANGGSGVAAGATWTPTGDLYINVDLTGNSTDNANFTLKELAVPEPGSLCMLALATLFAIGGRRARRA
ncbi:MAG: PEP-CTERM sorting domain-containing protein [Phycisphaerae bacterium]